MGCHRCYVRAILKYYLVVMFKLSVHVLWYNMKYSGTCLLRIPNSMTPRQIRPAVFNSKFNIRAFHGFHKNDRSNLSANVVHMDQCFNIKLC